MKKLKAFSGLIALISVVFFAACGGASTGEDRKTIKSTTVGGNLTVTLSNDTGRLKNGTQEIYLAFTDASGNPVDIKAASLNFNMPAMGSMAEMNDPATLTTTATPGLFKGNVNLQMAGEWIAQISYEGAQTGKTTMTMTAY